MDPAAVLRVFADLTHTRTPPALDVTANHQPFAWLGVRRSLFVAEHEVQYPVHVVQLQASPALDRLAMLDLLHQQEHLLREGWVFLRGSVVVDGTPSRVCVPLLSRPVRLTRTTTGAALSPSGDIEALRFVADRTAARQVEARATFGRGYLWNLPFEPNQQLVDSLAELTAWIRFAAATAGFEVADVLAPDAWADDGEGRDGDPDAAPHRVVAVVGSGLFLGRDLGSVDLSSTLLGWSGVPGIADTAFGALYGHPTWTPPPAASRGDDLRSSLPLTARQREVVRRSRRERLVVVSGPPGNGKSHVVLATALDSIARGEHVLIATQTDHAADVLAGMLARQPGPLPVLFGNADRRDRIASELGAGLGPALSAQQLDERRRAVEDIDRRVRWLERSIEATLARELHAEDLVTYEQLLPTLSEQVPAAFDLDADLDALLELAAEATASPAVDPFAAWRRPHASKRLRTALGVGDDVPIDVIGRALLVSRARRAAAELAAHGGTALGAVWDELARADAELALGVGSLVSDRLRGEHALNPWSRRAVAALASALRADRATRRSMLQSLDGESLLDALPLWIGTLGDIDDLLPAQPELFDLVVLDEASQIDQVRAAGALLRGTRALIVGDPHQLRHTPFVADLADPAAGRYEPDRVAVHDQFDVRLNSAFDTAAGATAVTWLDEHFRSVPHLIQFSAERFYREPIRLMTRHPRNDHADAITVLRVDGRRDGNGVNAAELAAVADVLDQLEGRQARNIGVLSPYAAQAGALEAMVLDTLSVAQVEAMDLRVGTVEDFQGSERDIVVASLAVSDDDSSETFAVLEDPNEFNVMVTRARAHMIVVTSLPAGQERFGWYDPSTRRPTDDDGGHDAAVRSLVGDYLAYADRVPESLPDQPVTNAWIRSLGDEVARLGTTVRWQYPVGEWTVDLCIGDGARAIGIECSVHPAGVAVHVARRRALQRAGWRLIDAFPSRWDGDAAAAAIAVVNELRRNGDIRR